MRRAARRLFQPAHESTRARASVRSVFRSCLGVLICLCIYIICRYMEMAFLHPVTAVKYGLPTPEEVAATTGRKILQAIAETASLGIIMLAGAW